MFRILQGPTLTSSVGIRLLSSPLLADAPVQKRFHDAEVLLFERDPVALGAGLDGASCDLLARRAAGSSGPGGRADLSVYDLLAEGAVRDAR